MTSKSNIILSETIDYPDILTIASSDSKEIIQNYLSDESKIITGEAKNIQKVFFPKTTEEVASILKEASKKRIQVTISGAGTGLTGSRVAFQGWIISTEKLKDVKPCQDEKIKTWTDSDSKQKFTVTIIEKEGNPPHIRVPVGMRLRTVHQLVKSLGYFYPPDTTEWSSFIGGNVATNASGARTFKYGSTRSYVEELVVVLSNGMAVRLTKNQTTDENETSRIL